MLVLGVRQGGVLVDELNARLELVCARAPVLGVFVTLGCRRKSRLFSQDLSYPLLTWDL